MSKILYYCDLHYGEDRPPYDDTSVQLYGTQALELQRAISIYAKQNDVTTIIHGGDESFFNPDPETHASNAKIISAQVTNVDCSLHRVIGNHEPAQHLEDLGFSKHSSVSRDGQTTIIIAQVEIKEINGVTLYAYDDRHVGKLLRSASNSSDNIIVAGHWSFDRLLRGYNRTSGSNKGYQYFDTTDQIFAHLQEIASGNRGVVTLHGHEHRFSQNPDVGFDCLVMPAITQADAETPDKPCGLFAEITDDQDSHGLKVTFKKIVLNDTSERGFRVETVSREYMEQYFRPVLL